MNSIVRNAGRVIQGIVGAAALTSLLAACATTSASKQVTGDVLGLAVDACGVSEARLMTDERLSIVLPRDSFDRQVGCLYSWLGSNGYRVDEIVQERNRDPCDPELDERCPLGIATLRIPALGGAYSIETLNRLQEAWPRVKEMADISRSAGVDVSEIDPGYIVFVVYNPEGTRPAHTIVVRFEGERITSVSRMGE